MLSKLRFIALAMAVTALYACATPPPSPEPIVIEEPVTTVDEAIPAPATEQEQAAPELSFAPPTVAVVLTNRNEAYEALAEELSELFASISIYDLSDKSQPPVSAFRLINDGQASAVIAVGLRAARSAIAMSTAPVIFSYVFNHQDHGLLQDHSRGVDAFAPLEQQLNAWKQDEPTLESIGLLIGPGHADLVLEAKRAAALHGISVSVVEAGSDQEALYLFKRIARDIDGFWLLPDNRVLSARVLREMIELANRRDVSVLAPNPSMLSMGASISVSPDTADVAERIHTIAEQIHRGQIDAVPPMTPLREIRIDTRHRAGTVTIAGRRSKAAEKNP